MCLGGRRRKRERCGVLQRGGAPAGSFVLRFSSVFQRPKAGILGEVLGEDLTQIFVSFLLMCQKETYSQTSSVLGMVGTNYTNWFSVIFLSRAI